MARRPWPLPGCHQGTARRPSHGRGARQATRLPSGGTRCREQFGDHLNTIAPSADGKRGLIPAYTVWNASFSYQVRRLRGALFVTIKNLFDRTYIVDRSRGILPGSPRLIQAGFTARFRDEVAAHGKLAWAQRTPTEGLERHGPGPRLWPRGGGAGLGSKRVSAGETSVALADHPEPPPQRSSPYQIE